MSFLLKPRLFKSMTSVEDVKRMAKKDVANALAKKATVEYVCATNVAVGSKRVSLFALTDNVQEWAAVLKELKVPGVASGKCEVTKAGGKVRIAVKTVSTGNREAVAKIANAALADPAIEAIDFASIASTAVQAPQPSEKALEMVRRSHEEAKKAGKIDRDFEVTDEVIKQMTRASTELKEYQKFAESFMAMANKYKFADVPGQDYKIVPVRTWALMLQGMFRSGYFKDDIPKAENGRDFILAYKGNEGQVIREKVLAEAMKGMSVFTDHAAKYLDRIVAEVRKASSGTPVWVFWSGDGAKDTAREENPSGIVLEGTIGGWFDNIWNFEPLTGVSTMSLWTSMSELYAKKAAQYYDVFSFRGYVGVGAEREQNVYNTIEKPTLIKVLDKTLKVSAPKIDWFAVDCVPDGGRFKGTGKPSVQAPSREAAIAKVNEMLAANQSAGAS